MKKLAAMLLMLSLLLTLCACGEEGTAPAAAPAVEEPEPSPEPTPEPTPEIRTEVVLKNDNLPEDYQLMEYAACTNSNMDAQTYVDTGVSPTNDTRFFFDFACTSGFVVKDTWFFGCFNRDAHMFIEVGYHQGQGNPANFYTATGIRYSQTEDSAARTVAYLHPGDYFYPNAYTGITYHEIGPCEQHFYIFARQHMNMQIANTDDTYGSYDLRVYACRIWQDGEPVRDFVPCYCISTGRAGMYDLVEGKMYYSAGSEEVQQGPAMLPPGSVQAVNGELTEGLEPPQLEGFLFRGYYTGPNGSGEQIIDADGQPCGGVGTGEGVVLYAFWVRDEAYFDQY